MRVRNNGLIVIFIFFFLPPHDAILVIVIDFVVVTCVRRRMTINKTQYIRIYYESSSERRNVGTVKECVLKNT